MLNIDKILKNKGWSKDKLAQEMDTSRVGLYSILNGNPTMKSLIKMATTLEVSLSELIECDNTSVVGFIKVGSNIHEIRSIKELKDIADSL